MKCVLDTNILVAALLSEASPPARLLDLWLEQAFTLVTAEGQLEELRRVSRYPKLRTRLKPYVVGTLINRLRTRADMVDPVRLDISADPDDNLILGVAVAAQADFLVTGDKSHLLGLGVVEGVRVQTARVVLERFL